jgi:glycerol kinase
VPRALLPEVRDSAGAFGAAEPEFLGAAVPITGIAGDQQAATVGQGCFAPGMIKSTYGTGCFVVLNTGTEAVASRSRLLTTIAYRLPGETAYALEGSIFIAGAAVQWLRDGLGLIADAAESEDLARSVDSADGVVFVPALSGLGSPGWDADARGIVSGLTRGTTRAHLVRATLEAIAHQVADVVDALPERPSVVRADGGATANAFLMQLQADLLQLPVEVAAERETTALGAAAVAGRLRARVGVAARFEPGIGPDEAAAARAVWSRALERARSDSAP